MTTSYGALVDAHGLSPAHHHVLDLVPAGSRVLDVGCAEGYLSAELARRGYGVLVTVGETSRHLLSVPAGTIGGAE